MYELPKTSKSVIMILHKTIQNFTFRAAEQGLLPERLIRLGIRRLVEPVMPALPVISLAELPSFVNLNTVATWELKHAS